MSTTDNDGATSSEREPWQRLHGLYRADLRPFEPVSDAQLLGAISRAEVHDEHDHASRSDIAAHLGFAHNSWTTRRLGPQLDALRTVGHIRDVHRYGLDLLALTAAGRRALGKARSAGQVILPESPQHRRWQHSRTIAHERIDGSVKRYEGRWPKPALCSTLSKSPRMRGSISPSAWGRRAGGSARPPTACTSGPSPTTHVPTPIRRRGSEDDATSGNGTGNENMKALASNDVHLWIRRRRRGRKQRCSLLLGSLYCNLVVGFLWFVLSSRCASHCGSRCLPSGCRVSLMVVRVSGGRAVLTSLPPVTVTVQSSCSRRARVVSSWLVVGFPGLRGVS